LAVAKRAYDVPQEGEIVIHRPLEEVFDFVADERNEPRYNSRRRGADKLSDGPIGVGTQFRAEIGGLGRTMEMITAITTYERPRRFGSRTRLLLMDTEGTLTFYSIPEGTLMRSSWEMEPRGMFKLLSPIMAGIGLRQEQADWEGLKRLLEE
jgi:hypothetical protein